MTIDTIPIQVSSYRPDGTREFVNRAWQEYTGVSQQDAAGRSWGSRYIPTISMLASAHGARASRPGAVAMQCGSGAPAGFHPAGVARHYRAGTPQRAP